MCRVSVATCVWGRAVCVYHTWLRLVALEEIGAPVERQADRTNSAAVSGPPPLMWQRNRIPWRRIKYSWSNNCANKSSKFSHWCFLVLESSIHPDALRVVNVTLKAGHYWNCCALSRYSGTFPWDYKLLLHLTFPFQSHICLRATTRRAYTSQMP